LKFVPAGEQDEMVENVLVAFWSYRKMKSQTHRTVTHYISYVNMAATGCQFC